MSDVNERLGEQPLTATATYGDERFGYEICYLVKDLGSSKRRIAIHVHPNGKVQVDAPSDADISSIKGAVRKRSRWVLNHLKSIQKRNEHVLHRQYVSGESHFYLGRRYVLKLVEQLPDNGKPKVILDRGKLTVFANQPTPEQTKKLLNGWYRNRAKQVFEKRLRLMCDKLTWLEQTPDWQLLAMTKQWGSCSPSGKISLNPQLIKAPTECVDYVLLHELCHLQEHNHSPRFYELLERAMPNWKAVKGKLDGLAEMILNE